MLNIRQPIWLSFLPQKTVVIFCVTWMRDCYLLSTLATLLDCFCVQWCGHWLKVVWRRVVRIDHQFQEGGYLHTIPLQMWWPLLSFLYSGGGGLLRVKKYTVGCCHFSKTWVTTSRRLIFLSPNFNMVWINYSQISIAKLLYSSFPHCRSHSILFQFFQSSSSEKNSIY